MTAFYTKIYTDGSCLGNPGPAGIGIILICGDRMRNISKPIGHGTNNIAEISAVVMALQTLKHRNQTEVELFTDSALVEGLLVRGWKAKANLELVHLMRDLASDCKIIRVTRIGRNSGNALNERCDELAKAGAASN